MTTGTNTTILTRKHLYTRTFLTLLLFGCVSYLVYSHIQSFAYAQTGVTLEFTENTISLDGSTTSVAITLSNNSTLLNSFSINVLFDPAEVTLHTITPTNALCEERFLISSTIDNEMGSADLVCGTITPFSAESGTLATIHFTNHTMSSTTFSFGEPTSIHAHDGFGTNVLTPRQESLVI